MTDDIAPALDGEALDRLRSLNEPGQPDVVREVVGLFLADAPERLRAIAAAVHAGDAAALQRAAHTMKGASATIGARSLQRVCRGLEEMGRDQRVASAAAELSVLDREFTRVKDALHQLL